MAEWKDEDEGVTFESDDAPEFQADEGATFEAAPEFQSESYDEYTEAADEWDEWDENEEWEESDVEVEGKQGFTLWSMAGIVTVVLGIAFFITGAILFLMGFPDQWYARDGYDYAASRRLVEGVVLGLGGGALFILLGNSMFQYGQTFTGTGYIHVEDE